MRGLVGVGITYATQAPTREHKPAIKEYFMAFLTSLSRKFKKKGGTHRIRPIIQDNGVNRAES